MDIAPTWKSRNGLLGTTVLNLFAVSFLDGFFGDLVTKIPENRQKLNSARYTGFFPPDRWRQAQLRRIVHQRQLPEAPKERQSGT